MTQAEMGLKYELVAKPGDIKTRFDWEFTLMQLIKWGFDFCDRSHTEQFEALVKDGTLKLIEEVQQ